MSRIDDFIATIHPYDSLPQDERARVARSFGRRHWPAGSVIYRQGEALPGIYLIESGAVRILDASGDCVSELGPRNSFGERGLLRDGLAVTTAAVTTDATVLMLPRDELMRLIDSQPAVARFFDRGGARPSDLALLKVGDLIGAKPPLSCPPDTPAVEAARAMRDAGAGSIGVVEGGRLVGLATIRDMSNRVLAEGRDPQTPIAQVMTPGPITLSPAELGYDVLNIMLERRISHLPVVEQGRFVGMVSQTDLTRVQALSASAVIRDIAQAADVAGMAAATARIPGLLVQMVGANYRHEAITRAITDIADAVTRRLLALAEADLGPAPGPWLWAACGSQGRQEQTGLSDQDNCLILGDDCDPDHPWFADLARFVSDGLNACGYVHCPGDMMATNPRWRQPRAVWRGYFRDWIDHPNPEAQMLASVMFDLRAIGGDAALLAGLQHNTLALAAEKPIFLYNMIENSLKHRPPLGLIGTIATPRSGQYRNRIDMKHNGVVPVIDLARVYALQGRLTPVNTRARLVEAQAAGIIGGRGAADLIAAYDLIQTARLENQAAQIRAGERPGNHLAPADLPNLDRSHLRDAFVVVRGAQSALGHGKGLMG